MSYEQTIKCWPDCRIVMTESYFNIGASIRVNKWILVDYGWNNENYDRKEKGEIL